MTTPARSFWHRLVQAATAPKPAAVSAVAVPHAGPTSAMRPLALEQRLMFDGAGAADATHAATDGAQPPESAPDTPSALHHALMAEAPATTTQRQEVVFVDSQVPNLTELLAGLSSNAEVVILDASKDGLQQMADYLQGRSGLDAIHVLSHGSEGTVQMGNVWLNRSNLAEHTAALQSIGAALNADGDLLLYGCAVGQGDKGQSFLDQLAAITGADVAASTDDTGAAALGGNWTLEHSSGSIETSALNVDHYEGLMTAVVPVPVISNLNGDSVAYVEDAAYVLLDNDSNAIVTDADSVNFAGGKMTVQITTGLASGEDVLFIHNQGAGANNIILSGDSIMYNDLVIGTFTGGSSGNPLVITFNGTATPTTVTALVHNLAYRNSNSTEPSTTPRTVSISMNDGAGGNSAVSEVTLNVLAVNDAPVVNLTASNPIYTENTSAVLLFSGASINTVETGQKIVQMTFTVSTVYNDAAEKLVIDGSDVALINGIKVVTNNNGTVVTVATTSGTATVTLSSSAGLDVATTQTILNTMAYRNDSESPNTANRVVTLNTVSDNGGSANGGIPTAAIGIFSTVTVVGVNDAPTGEPKLSGSAAEGQTLTASTANIADVDGLVGVTLHYQWQQSVDGTTWTDISGATAGTFSLGSDQVGKQVRVMISYTDNGGTLETLYSPVSTMVAGVVPTVTSIVRASAETVLSTATSITYYVTFNVAVSGVTSDDFTLTTASGNASGSIDSVVGSGTSWAVTVNSLAGDGTLRLDLRNSGTGITSGSNTAINSGYTSGQTFTLDHTAPVAPSRPTLALADDTGVSQSDGITNITTPTFTGTAEAGSTVKLYDTDGTTLLGTTSADSNGIWSITSNTLSDGVHSLTAKTTDAAGNTSAASQVLSITIDTATSTPSRPELSMGSDSGASDSDGITNITTPTFTGTAEAGSTVTLYDTYGTRELGTITADSNGKWFIIPSSALAQGTHTLTVKATDVAGNTSAASPPLNITIDTSAPTTYSASLTLSADTGSSNTDFITKTGTQTISGTLSANLQAGEMVYVSTDNGITWSLATNDGLNGWSISNCTLSPGSNTLQVKVSDTAGNNGVVLSQPYTLDTTPPTAPTVTAQTTQSVTPVLSGNATLASGERLIVSVGGATYNVTPAAGAWTLDLATAVPASGTLTLARNQEYSVVATVTDIAGNHSSGNAKLITGTTTTPENEPLGGNTLPPAAVVPPEPAHSTVPDYAYLGLLDGATPSGGVALFLGGRDFGASAFSTASEVREGWMQSMLESSTFNSGTFSLFTPANLDLQTGLQGMRLLPPVVEIMVGSDSTIVWQLPPSTLVGMDGQATVKLSMTQADGQPLPAWIKFDARTGELSGTMPPGFEGALTLRLTARDSQGNTVVKTIHLKASDVAPQGRAGMAEQLQRHAQLRAGQVMAQRLHL